MKNPNCDNCHCDADDGPVKVMPMTKDPHHGNLILCRSCWSYELAWRRARNRDLGKDAQYDLPAWESAQVYAPS